MKKFLLISLFFLMMMPLQAAELVLIPVSGYSDTKALFDEQNIVVHFYCNDFLIASAEAGLQRNHVILDEQAWRNGKSYYLVYFDENVDREAYLEQVKPRADLLHQANGFMVVRTDETLHGQLPPAKNDGMVRLFEREARLPAPFVLPINDDFEPNSFILDLMDQVSATRITTRVQHLEDYGTRDAYEPESILAQNWIESQFLEWELDVDVMSFTMPGGSSSDNVIATLTGTKYPNEYVIVGGHYDSISWSNDAPGADDNASGTSGVMEIAQILSDHTFERSIVFIAFSGEEYGLYGSAAYAQQSAMTGKNILGYINMDMIGYLKPGHTTIMTSLIYPPSAQELANYYATVTEVYLPDFVVEHTSLPSGYNSDHTSFNNNGYMGIFPFEDVNNFSPYIHGPNDLVGLSYNHEEQAAIFTRAALATVVSMASILNPTGFAAAGIAQDAIELTWNLNQSGNEVLLAWSEDGVFGNPEDGQSYSSGQTIPGGGTVIYSGTQTDFAHQGLDENNLHHYRIWSADSQTTYSTGTGAIAFTGCGPADLPFSDSFDDSDEHLFCWMAMENTAADGGLNGNNLTFTPAETEGWKPNTPDTSGDGADYIRSGTRSARVSSTSQDFQWLISQELAIPEEGQADLRFWVHYTNETDAQTSFHVLGYGDGWHTLLSWEDPAAESNHFDEEVVVSLGSFAGETIKVAFVYEAPGSHDVAIDDVRIALSMTTTADGQWSNPNIWDNQNRLPDDNYITDIHHEVSLDVETEVFGLNIHQNGRLAIQPGSALSVEGELLNPTGYEGLIIESDAGGAGSLIHQKGIIPLTAQLYIEGAYPSSHNRWHLIASPVEQNIEDFLPDPDQGAFSLFAWSEIENRWINHIDPDFETDSFLPGYGFIFTAETGFISEFGGYANVQDIVMENLSYNQEAQTHFRGWHLLGNPFTSSLTWDASLWELNHVLHTAKIWQDGGYIDVPSSGGMIPPMSGFFIKTTDSHNSLTMPADARIHQTISEKGDKMERIVLQASGTDSPWKQQTVIRFESDVAAGFDPRYDAYFLAGRGPLFHAATEDGNLSTLSLSDNDPEAIIYYYFEETDDDNLFHISLLENMAGVSLFLHDLHTNNIQQIKKDQPYLFEAVGSQTEQPRFALHFSESTLPVSIHEPEQEDSLFAWYHQGQINVHNVGNKEAIRLYDLQGRLLWEIKPDGQTQISIPAPLQPGLYLIRASGPQQASTVKVIVN